MSQGPCSTINTFQMNYPPVEPRWMKCFHEGLTLNNCRETLTFILLLRHNIIKTKLFNNFAHKTS